MGIHTGAIWQRESEQEMQGWVRESSSDTTRYYRDRSLESETYIGSSENQSILLINS